MAMSRQSIFGRFDGRALQNDVSQMELDLGKEIQVSGMRISSGSRSSTGLDQPLARRLDCRRFYALI